MNCIYHIAAGQQSFHLHPLILAETARFLSLDKASLVHVRPPNEDSYLRQASSNIRHIGRMIGCFAGFELAGTERSKSKWRSLTTPSTPLHTSPQQSQTQTPPPPQQTPTTTATTWHASLNHIAATFTKVLNSPDPIKEMVGEPPNPSPTQPSSRVDSIKAMLKAPEREYPQINSEEVKARLEVYFLRLYISMTPHSEENEKVSMSKSRRL